MSAYVRVRACEAGDMHDWVCEDLDRLFAR